MEVFDQNLDFFLPYLTERLHFLKFGNLNFQNIQLICTLSLIQVREEGPLSKGQNL